MMKSNRIIEIPYVVDQYKECMGGVYIYSLPELVIVFLVSVFESITLFILSTKLILAENPKASIS